MRGQVVDTQTGMPLEQVLIQAGNLNTSSDATGAFRIVGTLGDSLYFTRVGYKEPSGLWGKAIGLFA